jgi:hypothetical protein
MLLTIATAHLGGSRLPAQEQVKTAKLPNGGKRVHTTRVLRGAEVLQYQLDGCTVKQTQAGFVLSSVEEFDRDGHSVGGSGSFRYELENGGTAVKTYTVGRREKVSRTGTGTLRIPNAETRFTDFTAMDSEQMEIIDASIREINKHLTPHQVKTNGFVIFMQFPDSKESPRSRQLQAAAKLAQQLNPKEAAARINSREQKRVNQAYLRLLGLAPSK